LGRREPERREPERREPDRPRVPEPEAEARPRARGLHLTYDVLGNRTSLRGGDEETHYRYDAASQLLAMDHAGRHTEYRYDGAGRLTEEREGDRHRTVTYNGFGQPVSVEQRLPGRDERAERVYNGDSLLASLNLTSENRETDAQRGALVRYWWGTGQLAQILTQRAEPRLDDAERDRPGRLDADFAYGYGRTFASSEHAAATFHRDAFASAIRTEDTAPWVQAGRYGTFGTPEGFPEHERHEPDHPGHQWRDHERPDHERWEHERPDDERPDDERPDDERWERERPDQDRRDDEWRDHDRPDHHRPEHDRPDYGRPDHERWEPPAPEL